MSEHQVMETANQAYERLLAQEALILDATELISELMEASGVSRTELAKRIGKARGFVTQVLSGSRNMTLRTLADFAYALDARVTVQTQPIASLYGRSTLTAQTTAALTPSWRSLMDYYYSPGPVSRGAVGSSAFQVGSVLMQIADSTVITQSMLSEWAAAGLLPQGKHRPGYGLSFRPKLKVIQGNAA